MEQANLQDVLWQLADPWGWRIYAFLCAGGGLVLFYHLLKAVDRDALTIGRLIWLGACITGSFVRLNSAFEFISPMLWAGGGMFLAVLVQTRWCFRRGTFGQKVLAVLREALYANEPKAKVHTRRMDGD